MKDVIRLAEHQQRADGEHVVGTCAQEPAADTQQKIDEAKQQTESAGAAGRS